MQMDEKQEQKLTSSIRENRIVILKKIAEIDDLITQYLKEKNVVVEEKVEKVSSEPRPVNDDRITNLINDLENNNRLIKVKMGKQIEELCSRLSRL